MYSLWIEGKWLPADRESPIGDLRKPRIGVGEDGIRHDGQGGDIPSRRIIRLPAAAVAAGEAAAVPLP